MLGIKRRTGATQIAFDSSYDKSLEDVSSFYLLTVMHLVLLKLALTPVNVWLYINCFNSNSFLDRVILYFIICAGIDNCPNFRWCSREGVFTATLRIFKRH
jgi:hypothetical protein